MNAHTSMEYIYTHNIQNNKKLNNIRLKINVKKTLFIATAEVAILLKAYATMYAHNNFNEILHGRQNIL